MRAMDSAVISESQMVPRPAPSGVDSADDMHDNTLMPYISDAMGFFSAFIANVSWALISTNSHTPSSRSDARIAFITARGWVMS